MTKYGQNFLQLIAILNSSGSFSDLNTLYKMAVINKSLVQYVGNIIGYKYSWSKFININIYLYIFLSNTKYNY